MSDYFLILYTFSLLHIPCSDYELYFLLLNKMQMDEDGHRGHQSMNSRYEKMGRCGNVKPQEIFKRKHTTCYL